MSNLQQSSKEVWLPVKGFENYYIVSNHGNVKSFTRSVRCKIGYRRMFGKTLEFSKIAGYRNVRLFGDNGKKRLVRVHRLVAEHFIPNPENKPYINHINNIHHDNRVENLEWCTPKENTAHAVKMGLMKQGRSANKGLTNTQGSKPVKQMDMNGNVIRIFPSAREAVRQGVVNNFHGISHTIRGRLNSYMGYKWAYAS
jgi:hypothetical protein